MTSDRVPGVGLELQQKMEIGVTPSRIGSNVLGKSRELQIRANDNAETQRSAENARLCQTKTYPRRAVRLPLPPKKQARPNR